MADDLKTVSVKASCSAEEWKNRNDRDFEKNSAARSERYETNLRSFDDRNRETGDTIASVRSAVDTADTKESLEKAAAYIGSDLKLFLLKNWRFGRFFKISGF